MKTEIGRNRDPLKGERVSLIGCAFLKSLFNQPNYCLLNIFPFESSLLFFIYFPATVIGLIIAFYLQRSTSIDVELRLKNYTLQEQHSLLIGD